MNLLFPRAPTAGFRLFLLVILASVLMMLDYRQSVPLAVRSTLSLLVVPIQYAVDWPIKTIAWVTSTITSQESLREENAYLRTEQVLLKAQLQQFAVLEKENHQLRTLLQSAPDIGGKAAVAQLLMVASSPSMQQIVLDYGAKENVYLGQPVLDASGVVGQVIQVGPLTSRVLLITDSRSAIPVQVERTGMRAIAEGTGSLDTLTLVNVPRTAEIEVGDVLVTSGLEQRFPVGYPVGTVSAILDKPGESFVDVTVLPAAQLQRSRLVLLVWPSERKQALYDEKSYFIDSD